MHMDSWYLYCIQSCTVFAIANRKNVSAHALCVKKEVGINTSNIIINFIHTCVNANNKSAGGIKRSVNLRESLDL